MSFIGVVIVLVYQGGCLNIVLTVLVLIVLIVLVLIYTHTQILQTFIWIDGHR